MRCTHVSTCNGWCRACGEHVRQYLGPQPEEPEECSTEETAALPGRIQALLGRPVPYRTINYPIRPEEIEAGDVGWGGPGECEHQWVEHEIASASGGNFIAVRCTDCGRVQ